MFYLKYRPKKFEELDNSKVARVLPDILSAKDLPHAFLFTGQKGMGKTSVARIVAKSVNCLDNFFANKSKSIEPCNNCKSCKEIETSSSPDVVEMDAASNRGIDEIRSLIRNSAYAPMISRYKVYIIDEAHMITNDGFNALLKTLEEPPKSTIFILATTNEEKLLKTVVSRCIKVSFGKAIEEDMKKMIKRVAKSEGVEIKEDVINLIVSYADRSFRDGVKIFEELCNSKSLELEKAKKHLGSHGDDLLSVLDKKGLKEALEWIKAFGDAGGDVKRLIEKMQEDLHEQLLLKNGVYIDGDVKQLGFSNKDISRLMKLLNESFNLLRSTPIDIIPLEIAVIEFYNYGEKG